MQDRRSFLRFRASVTKRAVVALLAMAAGAGVRAQIPVTDIILNVTQATSYAEQLLQYAEEVSQYVQMVRDYQLELENLAELPGDLRNELTGRLGTQLQSNLGDYGVSALTSLSKSNPDVATFYARAEALYRRAYGSAPRTPADLASDLETAGIRPTMDEPMYRAGSQGRVSWERLLDDMRQSAVSRQNAEDRSQQATSISRQMASLSDNHTVAALQLLAGQQTLAYTQQEEALKTEAQMLRSMQERDAKALAEEDAWRQRELDRLARVKTRNVPTAGAVPLF